MSGGNDSWEIAYDWANEKQVNVPETFRRRRVIEGIELPTLQDKEELMKRGCYLFVSEEGKDKDDSFPLNEWSQVDQMAYELLHGIIKSGKYAISNDTISFAYKLADEFERVRRGA